MVDVVTDTVAAYTADPLLASMADGNVYPAARVNQWIADMISLNDSLNGTQQVTA